MNQFINQEGKKGGYLMEKKDDAKLISEKAKSYFEQGFN